jgi:NAD(P)-dependent dehydrogenase (short-subunit alcohol dehydrogenase family)
VNVSSLQAVAAFPASFAYEASKGGVDALTRQVAVEYGSAGIRCNAVRPGAIDTPMAGRTASEAADPEAEWASYADLHPLGRVGRAEEVAAVIAFLLGPDASFVTGACVAVDGGAGARCYPYSPDPDLAGTRVAGE